jgi:hypothetical protein
MTILREVGGFVKPNAGTDTLISMTTIQIENLTQRDVLVFWGGSNGVSRNNCKNGLKQILNLVETMSYKHYFVQSAS